MRQVEYTDVFCLDIEAILDYFVSVRDQKQRANLFFNRLQDRILQIKKDPSSYPAYTTKHYPASSLELKVAPTVYRSIIPDFHYAIYFYLSPDNLIRFERILHRDTVFHMP